MSSHAYHDALPDYDERQIWHDGCEECEFRGNNVPRSICQLDDENFLRAWNRSLAWNNDENIGHASKAEQPLLNAIYYFNIALSRVQVPIG